MSITSIESSPGDWLSELLNKAIAARASDIHFEPERENYNVRFRVDGLLVPVETLSKFFQQNFSSRLKVIAQIDIADHYLPKSGHFEFNNRGIIYNIRVSTLPSIYGETIALRMFNREDILIGIDKIGLDADQLALLNQTIKNPSGIILATGSTGSGKTTLLYSILHTLNTPERNIITIEDPIEYQMANVRQCQINESQGLTFAKAMRGVVRQDPDVVMLGEIRDDETAQMAFQAALIGTLVLSTFHTFDVPALVIRLEEMGVERSVIAQAINGVISTRLVRKICSACRESYQPDEKEAGLLGINPQGLVLQKGKGCPQCRNSGFLGRTGIFEIVHFDEDLKASIIENRPASFVYEMLHTKKTLSLKDVAVKKIMNGETTVSEATRVLGLEFGVR